MKLTEKEQIAYDHCLKLRTEQTPITPTNVGMAMGKSYSNASAYTGRTLVTLVEKGYLIKMEDKRCTYSIAK